MGKKETVADPGGRKRMVSSTTTSIMGDIANAPGEMMRGSIGAARLNLGYAGHALDLKDSARKERKLGLDTWKAQNDVIRSQNMTALGWAAENRLVNTDQYGRYKDELTRLDAAVDRSNNDPNSPAYKDRQSFMDVFSKRFKVPMMTSQRWSDTNAATQKAIEQANADRYLDIVDPEAAAQLRANRMQGGSQFQNMIRYKDQYSEWRDRVDPEGSLLAAYVKGDLKGLPTLEKIALAVNGAGPNRQMEGHLNTNQNKLAKELTDAGAKLDELDTMSKQVDYMGDEGVKEAKRKLRAQLAAGAKAYAFTSFQWRKSAGLPVGDLSHINDIMRYGRIETEKEAREILKGAMDYSGSLDLTTYETPFSTRSPGVGPPGYVDPDMADMNKWNEGGGTDTFAPKGGS